MRTFNPKVSVIIPTIGRKSLKDAIESVVNQTYKNLEIIITDDTENEKAKSKIEKYLKDQRIKYVVNKKYKHGPAGNRNNGLDCVTGEYFTFLDDDDVLFPNAIEELLKCALEKNCKIVFANCIDNVKKEFTGKHYGKSEMVFYKDMLCGKFEGEYCGLNKTSLLNGERFNDECWGGEWILWMKLWKKAQYGFYLHKPLKVYSIETLDRVTNLMVKKAEKTYLNYTLFLESFGKDLILNCPKVYVRHSLRGIYFAKLAGKYREVLKLYFNSLKACPKLFLLPTLWAMFCLITPKFLVFKIYESFLEKFKGEMKRFLK